MAYTNLPGIFENILDGNLTIVPQNNNPIVMVLGTAAQGESESVYRVTRVNDAARTYGKSGTLVRGLYESSLGGALNIRLFRVGATPAKVTGIGSGGTGSGITVETVSRDDSAGTDYQIFYNDLPGTDEGRLRVYRASNSELVYDNNPASPLDKVDLGEVSVSGTASAVNTSVTLTGTFALNTDTTLVGTGSALTTSEVETIIAGGGRVFLTLGGETVEVASVTDDTNAVLVSASTQTASGLTAVLEAFSDENTIGSESNPVELAYVATNDPGGSGVAPAAGTAPVDVPVYTAGTDGLSLSRMKLYEALDRAYSLLEDQEIDVVIPMNVYLDDLNCMDIDATSSTTTALNALSDYPSAGTSTDALGRFYKEDYNGETHYWWWFPSDPTADADTTFTTDVGTGTGIIAPSVGSASTDTKADGTALTGSDFSEVNFAHQLATFCYTQSRDNTEMTGVIGVKPPNSFGLKDVSNWVGSLPTTELSGDNVVVASGGNGTGLLGNKFMSGRIGVTSELVPFTIDGVAGLFNGGLIATDSGFVDGTQLKDANDSLIDIGKYISVVATYPVLSNPSSNTSYTASAAPTYAGLYSALPANSAPTYKTVSSVSLPYRISVSKLDLLAGQRYVSFQSKTRGIVVADAPTAARPNSDYRRLSTVRQVKATVDQVRLAAEPFLGEGMNGTLLAALETAVDTKLKGLVKQGIIARYDFQLTSTLQQRILGQATLELKIVPAFELRQLTVVVGLAAV